MPKPIMIIRYSSTSRELLKLTTECSSKIACGYRFVCASHVFLRYVSQLLKNCVLCILKFLNTIMYFVDIKKHSPVIVFYVLLSQRNLYCGITKMTKRCNRTSDSRSMFVTKENPRWPMRNSIACLGMIIKLKNA